MLDVKRGAHLLGYKAICTQILEPKSITDFIDNDISFKDPYIKALYDVGMPINSINSIKNCGVLNDYLIRSCSCGNVLVPLYNRCNSRTCKNCARRRINRIRKKFMPFLSNYKQDKANFFYFLTIAPKNYEDLRYGLKHIRHSFEKFRRHKYVKERIKAGFYVIETKDKTQEGKGWNVHIHAVIYGRYLDNKIRGKCLDCSQTLIKKDRVTGKYYCTNVKCNSLNVDVVLNSKLVRLFKRASGAECNIHVKSLSSVSYALNYTLKYISTDKNDFSTPLTYATYTYITRKQKLIVGFGWKKGILIKKEDMPVFCCSSCGEKVRFIYNTMMANDLLLKPA